MHKLFHNLTWCEIIIIFFFTRIYKTECTLVFMTLHKTNSINNKKCIFVKNNTE